MRYTNTEVLFRNRRVFAKARDAAFAEASRLLDEILALYSENGDELAEPPVIKKLMARLVDRLYHARYFAQLSAGGNNVAAAPEVGERERAYIDHVETMYSYSRSINRFLRHEVLLHSFIREHPDVSPDLRAYFSEIRASDANLIHNNLSSMRDRLRAYERFMKRDETAAAAGAARDVAEIS